MSMKHVRQACVCFLGQSGRRRNNFTKEQERWRANNALNTPTLQGKEVGHQCHHSHHTKMEEVTKYLCQVKHGKKMWTQIPLTLYLQHNSRPLQMRSLSTTAVGKSQTIWLTRTAWNFKKLKLLKTEMHVYEEDLHCSNQTPIRNRTPPEGVYNIPGLEWHMHKHPVEEGSCSVLEVLKNGWASKDQGLINTKVKSLQPKPSGNTEAFLLLCTGLTVTPQIFP